MPSHDSENDLSLDIDGTTTRFHFIWLRDHCHCLECYFDTTKQRLLNSATIYENII